MSIFCSNDSISIDNSRMVQLFRAIFEVQYCGGKDKTRLPSSLLHCMTIPEAVLQTCRLPTTYIDLTIYLKPALHIRSLAHQNPSQFMNSKDSLCICDNIS
jgi:hypothetical protein